MVDLGSGTKCRIELLGRLRICVGDTVVDHFPTQKTAGLLAYLAQEQTKVSRDQLVDILWPDAEPISGRNRLNQAVSTLRRILPLGVLGSDSKSLWLEPQSVETDLQDFERIRRGETSPRNGGLYRGPYLDGMKDTWILPRRTELATAYTDQLLRGMNRAVEAGTPDVALAEALKVLRHDATMEAAHKVVIRSYLDLGQPEAACQAFSHMQDVLPPDVTHRAETLELISHAERMAAVGRTDPFVAFQPVLPKFNDPILGREVEMQQLADLLTEKENRCVLLSGLPGVGKTRLAIAAASRAAAPFEGRVTYISCEQATTKLDLRREAVRALTGGASSDPREFDDLVVKLNPARPFLMVLDHADALPDRDESVRQLLYFIPGLKVLVVSRHHSLSIPSLTMDLGPFAPDDASSTTLFARRYQTIRPEYTFSAADWTAVEQIVRLVGGIPAHLEGLASRARLLTPRQIADHLSDSPTPLYANHIREILSDLSAPQQLALHRLALVSTPMTLETVRGLGPELDLEDWALLERLGWLQSQVDSRNHAAYVVPPVFREALSLEMSPEELNAARSAVADFCVQFASLADAETYSDQFFEAVRRISDNRSIIRQSLNYLLAAGRWEQMAQLTNSLGLYWRHVAEPGEGIETLRELLDSGAATSLSAEMVSQLRLLLGGLHRISGDLWSAKEQYDRAWQHYETSDDSRNRLRCLFGLAASLHENRQYAEERALLEDTLRLAQEDRHRVFQAYANQRLGHNALREGHEDVARDHFLRALVLSQEAGAESYEAAALDAIALLDLRRGKYDLATNQLIASLRLQEKNHDYYGMADNKVYLARAWVGLGELDRARVLLLEVLESNESGQNLRDNFVAVLAHYAVAHKDWSAAAKLLGFIGRAAIGGRHLAVLIADEMDALSQQVKLELGDRFEADFGQGQIFRPRDLLRMIPGILTQD